MSDVGEPMDFALGNIMSYNSSKAIFILSFLNIVKTFSLPLLPNNLKLTLWRFSVRWSCPLEKILTNYLT